MYCRYFISEEVISMKEENIESAKLSDDIKKRKYEQKIFGDVEDGNIEILRNMLYHITGLNDKYFFKQLGQFLGGLYTIALNRNKLKGLKWLIEQFKDPEIGVKGLNNLRA